MPVTRLTDSTHLCYIVTQESAYPVTLATADDVFRKLARFRPPRWIEFYDIGMGLVRVRSELVESITETFATQRAKNREVDSLIEQEDRRFRQSLPWLDDDSSV